MRTYFADGSDEPVHGHTWKVELLLARADGGLDEKGICLDFVPLQEMLDQLLRCIGHGLINDLPEFKEVNPTAENVARWFYYGIKKTAEQVSGKVLEVRVHEGPGNTAIFRPEA